jgi:hypothetical protein
VTLPDVVYVPAHPVVWEGRRDVELEVRQLADGRPALPVFTNLERLVASLGEAQPWVTLPLQAARALMAAAGVTDVVIDAPVAPDAWHWHDADLAAYLHNLDDE